MEDAILTSLAAKTRIIATHALAYLPYFDYVVVMDRGEIVQYGKYDEICRCGVFEEIKRAVEVGRDTDDEVEGVKSDALGGVEGEKTKEDVFESGRVEDKDLAPLEDKSNTTIDKVIDHIISTEDKVEGEVITWDLTKQYIKLSGGVAVYIIILISTLLLTSRHNHYHSCRTCTTIFLAILDNQLSKFKGSSQLH